MVEKHIGVAKVEFDKALAHLHEEYARLQVGRAHPGLVEGLLVSAYGSYQPLKNLASISIPDPKTLQIQPWDRSIMSSVEKAIRESTLGLNPVNSGVAILLNIPPLTEERRRDLTKIVKKLAEDAKISVRTARQVAHNAFKELEAAKQIREDDKFAAEESLQKVVDDYNKKIDDAEKAKTEAIMKV